MRPPHTNPVHGPNRLKLGIFGTNSMGLAQTTVPERHALSWDASLRAVRAADDAGFEALVPYARWKGYLPGDTDHPSNWVLDSYAWAAAVAAVTSHAGVFATSHPSTMHPVLAAKQAATIDHVSGGRFALNVVGGWNKPELDMFGVPMGDHDRRYDQLAEWLQLVQRLWTDPHPITRHGDFFTVIEGVSEPKPLQPGGPPIMNAGGSDRGRHFAAAHADLAFVILTSDEPDSIRASVDSYRNLAHDTYHRDLQVWTYAYVVQRDTREAAEAYEHHYAVEHGDRAAADASIAMQLDHGSLAAMPEHVIDMIRRRITAGGGGYRLVGTADDIAEQLQTLADAGIDGALLSWVDYDEGLAAWNAQVMPRLERAGLRKPFEKGSVA